MLGTAKKVLAVTAIGFSVALTTGSANAADTIDIRTYIDDQGSAKNGTEGEKAVSSFSIPTIGGVAITAGAGSHTLEQGAFVDRTGDTPNPWSAYHDYGNAGMGVTQHYDSDPLSDDYLQSVDVADDNTQGVAYTDTGEILTLQLTNIGDNYRIDELYFRNDGHTPEFDTGKTVGISMGTDTDGGACGAGDSCFAGDGSANSWTNYSLADGVTDNTVIGALLSIPTGGIVMTAGDVLYMAFTNQQFYLSGFTFTILNDQLEPVPLPAGIVLLLSGLLGLGFLGRYRSKQA